MTGVAIATGVAALAGVVGTMVSASATRKAQQSANEQNAALMREQMAYQTGERIAAQEYNTPASQRQRFAQAGINPYAMLGNINAGNTEAMTGVGLPDMQAAPDLALSNMIQGLGAAPEKVMSMVNGIQQIQGQQEAVKAARIENSVRLNREITNINKTQAEIQEKMMHVKKGSAEYDNLKQQLDINAQALKRNEIELRYMDDYMNARNKRERNMADLAYQQQVGQYFQNQITQTHAKYAGMIDRATLNKINAEAANQLSAVQANKELATLYNQKGITEFEMRVVNKAGVKLDNEQKNIVNQYLGEQIHTALDAQRMQTRQGEQDYSNPFKYIGSVLPALVGAGLGAAVGGPAGAGLGAAAGSSLGAGFSSTTTGGNYTWSK